ncbi:MAG: hypothetical protein ACTHK1_08720 [Actinomycetales bacterium]
MPVVLSVLAVCVAAGLLVLLASGAMALHDVVERMSPRYEPPSHISPHGVLSSPQRHHRMASRFERVEDLAVGWRRRRDVAAPDTSDVAGATGRTGSVTPERTPPLVVDVREQVRREHARQPDGSASRA